MQRTGKYICYFLQSDTNKEFDSLQLALEAARKYVGNAAYTKPFPHEETYLFGPGDGTTSVTVREKIIF